MQIQISNPEITMLFWNDLSNLFSFILYIALLYCKYKDNKF